MSLSANAAQSRGIDWPSAYATRAVLEAALGRQWSPQVWDRALDYGVDALLYRYARWAKLPICAQAERRWREHGAQVLWRRALMGSLVESLEEIGPVVVLKGEALSQLIYDDGLARRSGDVDLLMRLEDVPQAGELLLGMGYQPMYRDRVEPWLYDQWAWVHPETAMVVELHWAICAPPWPAPSTQALIAEAEPIALRGISQIKTLNAAASGLHVALHFAHHGGHLKGLLDVAGWWDRFGGDAQIVEAMWALARSAGVSGALMWPLEALGALMGRSLVGQRRASMQALGLWTAGCVCGALLGADAVRGSAALAFKTQQTLQAQVMLWQMVGALILDDPMYRVKAMGFVWFRSPQVFAAERGDERVMIGDYIEMALRPARLAYRATRGQGEVSEG